MLLVGSRPPPNDSVWHRARAEGFEVEVFDRNAANKEKQVDNHITTMVDDSHEHMKPERGDMAVLVAGDGDYIPSVRSLQKRGSRSGSFSGSTLPAGSYATQPTSSSSSTRTSTC